MKTIIVASASLFLLTASTAEAKLGTQRTIVDLPAKVTEVNACTWTAAGGRLVCMMSMRGTDGRQLVTMRPSGKRLRCLTCAAGVPGARRPHKVSVFPDGRRFLLGTLPANAVNADEGASLVSYVGACAPSLARCEQLSFKPVQLPANTGSLNDREVRLSPDGRWFAYTIVRTDGFLMLMGELVEEADRYVVRDARVLNPHGSTTAADLAGRGAFAEAKSFRGAGTLVYASTEQQGQNLDLYRLDLATGAETRITTNGEWDEDADYDPQERLIAIGSTRRHFNALRGATVVPVPPFLDQVKTVFFARFKLANPEERRRALEPWITTEAIERRGGFGRSLSDLRGGWDARMPVRFSPDGTRVVFYEVGPGTQTRLVVARIVGRKPVRPRPPEATPAPTWAPLLTDYPPLLPGPRVVAGPAGGTATIVLGGLVIGGAMRVDYDGYTTADGLILDGTETIEGFAFRDLRIELRGDVRVTGAQRGRVTASVSAEGRSACGTITGVLGDRRETTYFGRTDPRCGFPTPPACGNRRDDDGDGLEDLTDRGCRDEEDRSEGAT